MGGPSKIAFAPGEPLLLTIDGSTLLAYDAVLGTAKWQLGFDQALVGVVFASMRAFPRASGNPWRTPASACEAVAIDVAGGVHAIDATTGTVLARHRCGGTPKAAAGRGDVVAVALAERVVVWRDGSRHELDLAAVALAFARDGLTLGIATKAGELVIVDARTLDVTAKHELCLDVNGLTASRYGWIVATDRDLRSVDGEGVAGKILEGPVERTALDVAGKRLAVHRSDTSITVYGWPPVLPQTRITLGKGHHLVDLSFGEGDALAVGIDRGDAAIVDVARRTVVRTESAGGRPDRRWSLRVEEEATRTARTNAQVKAETTKRAAPAMKAGRFGFGLLVAVVLAAVRVLSATSRTHHWSPPPTPKTINLVEHTAKPTSPRPPSEPVRDLVRLRGSALTPEIDDITLHAGDHPKLWAAPTGALTLVTRGSRASCMLRTKAPHGDWKTVHDDPSCREAALFVRTPTEAYASFDGVVLAFDGKAWSESEPPLDVPIASLSGPTAPGSDLYALDEAHILHRRHGATWSVEPASSAIPETLYAGPTLMARTNDDALLRWTPDGFTVRAAGPILDLWMSPSGQLFAARGAKIGRSIDGGTTWSNTRLDGFHDHIWGRSDTEVYAAGDSGVRRFDGKAWTRTTVESPVDAITGSATDLWVVTRKR